MRVLSFHNDVNVSEQVFAVDDRSWVDRTIKQLILPLFKEIPSGEIYVHLRVGRVCSTSLRAITVFKNFSRFSGPSPFNTPDRPEQFLGTIGELLLHGERQVDFVHAPAQRGTILVLLVDDHPCEYFRGEFGHVYGVQVLEQALNVEVRKHLEIYVAIKLQVHSKMSQRLRIGLCVGSLFPLPSQLQVRLLKRETPVVFLF